MSRVRNNSKGSSTMSLRMKWSLLPTVMASVAIVTGNIGASLPAQAQSAPPPAPPGAAPAPTATDSEPPARVGWLSNLSGSVSFHSAGQDQWVTAGRRLRHGRRDAHRAQRRD
jgi:hypothetical protein